MPRQAYAPLRIFYTMMDSPFGPVCLAGTEQGLTRADFQCGDRPVQPASAWQEDTGLLDSAKHQLQEYFQGQRQSFTLPLAPPGTPFQQRVWQELQRLCGWYHPQAAPLTARRRTALTVHHPASLAGVLRTAHWLYTAPRQTGGGNEPYAVAGRST